VINKNIILLIIIFKMNNQKKLNLNGAGGVNKKNVSAHGNKQGNKHGKVIGQRRVVTRAAKPRVLIMTRYYSCGSTCKPPVPLHPCGCSS
jgi:hypothetical protein